MVIVFDMDDVLVDLIEPWVQELNSKYGTHVSWNDITQWDMKIAFPTLTWEQIFSVLYEPEFWDKVQPYKEALEYLPKFYKKHKIYIATAAHTKTIDAKINRCLYKHFPFLTEDNIIMIRDKSLLCCDWIIDDNPENLLLSPGQTICIDKPWNRSYENRKQTYYEYRVNNLKDVYNIIEGGE